MDLELTPWLADDCSVFLLDGSSDYGLGLLDREVLLDFEALVLLEAVAVGRSGTRGLALLFCHVEKKNINLEKIIR